MRNRKITFKDLVRQNTGISMMDSGGANGRHWQRPALKKDYWMSFSNYRENEYDVNATINLATFLESHLEIDQRLTNILRKKECSNYIEAAEYMSEYLGIEYHDKRSDNTCNHENDLSQDFQFSVLSNETDWYYDDKALIIIETHNGADIRGGYSDFVVCKPANDGLSCLFDITCGFSILSGINPDGSKMSHEGCQQLDDRWQVGYSSCPASELNRDIEKVLTKQNKSGEYSKLKLLLKSGHVVTIGASPRLGY